MRSALFLIAVSTFMLLVLPVSAASQGAPPPLVFPVDGSVTYTDSFGDPRDGGSRAHEGIDIMTEDGKGVPVVAAADGVVSWVDDECCHLAIDHVAGWSTWYLHLNNDTSGTDDGEGWGIADGIEVGSSVVAGQVIGWVGDSGNAEATAPHLHFELRHDGDAVNPYDLLVGAVDGGEGDLGGSGSFHDDDESVHEANIEVLASRGITRGCNPPSNDHYCPESLVTRGELAAFLRRLLDLKDSPVDHYDDDGTSEFEADIDAVTDAGIGFECRPGAFCPDDPVRRDEMAEFLVRTFAEADEERYSNEDRDWFQDDAGNLYEEAINRLRAAGVTIGCDPPDNVRFCPDRPLTRAEMATFIARALAPAM